MEIRINGTTVEEIAAKLLALTNIFNRDVAQVEMPIVSDYGAIEAKAIAVEKIKEKAPKKAKKDVEVVETPIVTESPVVNAEIYTHVDATTAAQKLTAAKDIQAARTVLSQFKNDKGEICKRINEIQHCEIGMFVKACDEAAL
jgi:hypothetical protein